MGPNEWNAVLAISTSAMAIAIVFSAFYAAIQLQDIKKTRHSALLMQLHQIWDSDSLINARQILNEYCEDISFKEAGVQIAKDVRLLDRENQDKFYIIVRLANFFENLGYLTCKGHLDKKHSLEIFGSAANKYWLLMKDIAYYKRTKPDKAQPDIWKYFEYLGKGCPKKDACLKIEVTTYAK